MQRTPTRYIDIAFCIVLLPAMIMLLPIERWMDNNMLFVVLLFALLYAIYWLHRLVTIPMLLGARPNYYKPLALLLFTLFLTYLLSLYPLEGDRALRVMMKHAKEAHDSIDRASSRSLNKVRSGRTPIKMHQQAIWFLYVVVTTFSAMVSLLSEINRQIMERQAVEFERKKAELALYKAQINPHFLFNTLNTLLGMVITKSEKTEEAFVQFSSLMRYMCNNSTLDTIPLLTEMEYINQYIGLQRNRLNDHTSIEIKQSSDEELERYKIAPMLLITFVENAVKYGASTTTPSTIEISSQINNGVLIFTTRNQIFEQSTPSGQRSKGIGIENCKSRLELLYHNRHTLIIRTEEREHSVSLTIKLDPQ